MPDPLPIDDPGHLVQLDCGVLSSEQVNLLFEHLPFDLSFADERDVLRSFTSGPSYQSCKRETIGGSLQACHPVSTHRTLERMLMAFRNGRTEPFVKYDESPDSSGLVRYLPVRDAQGAYRGILEVIENVRRVRALKGEQRLRLW